MYTHFFTTYLIKKHTFEFYSLLNFKHTLQVHISPLWQLKHFLKIPKTSHLQTQSPPFLLPFARIHHPRHIPTCSHSLAHASLSLFFSHHRPRNCNAITTANTRDNSWMPTIARALRPCMKRLFRSPRVFFTIDECAFVERRRGTQQCPTSADLFLFGKIGLCRASAAPWLRVSAPSKSSPTPVVLRADRCEN